MGMKKILLIVLALLQLCLITSCAIISNNIRIEKWATIEKLQELIQNKQYSQIPSLFTEGKYKNIAINKMERNLEGFLKSWTVASDTKERYISGKLPLRFKMEDGEWKIHEQ